MEIVFLFLFAWEQHSEMLFGDFHVGLGWWWLTHNDRVNENAKAFNLSNYERMSNKSGNSLSLRRLSRDGHRKKRKELMSHLEYEEAYRGVLLWGCHKKRASPNKGDFEEILIKGDVCLLDLITQNSRWYSEEIFCMKVREHPRRRVGGFFPPDSTCKHFSRTLLENIEIKINAILDK